MSIHLWGEKDFDWDGLNAAIAFIAEGLLKRRINVRQYKEKFGGARIYCSLGLLSFEQLLRPGHCFSRWPYWARWLDYSRLAHVIRKVLNLVVYPYHCRVYREHYRLAVIMWPHLRAEILEPADWPKVLEGL
jgi:hypothetical protein